MEHDFLDAMRNIKKSFTPDVINAKWKENGYEYEGDGTLTDTLPQKEKELDEYETAAIEKIT